MTSARTTGPSSPTRGTQVLATILGGSGAIHLIRPAVYEPIVPAWVPAHREVVLGSGVVELVLAAGLLAPATRRAAGWGSIALLLGVYPANLQMTADAMRGRSAVLKAASVARLPLQWPAIRLAWQAAHDG